MTLLYGKQANQESQLGPVHGAKADQDGTLSVQLWPGKFNTHSLKYVCLLFIHSKFQIRKMFLVIVRFWAIELIYTQEEWT